MNEIKTAPAAIVATIVLGMRLPKIPLTANPAAGKRGISQIRSRKFIPLPLHEIDFVNVHRFLVLEHGDNNAQPDGGFSGGDGDYENREHLTGDLSEAA